MLLTTPLSWACRHASSFPEGNPRGSPGVALCRSRSHRVQTESEQRLPTRELTATAIPGRRYPHPGPSPVTTRPSTRKLACQWGESSDLGLFMDGRTGGLSQGSYPVCQAGTERRSRTTGWGRRISPRVLEEVCRLRHSGTARSTGIRWWRRGCADHSLCPRGLGLRMQGQRISVLAECPHVDQCDPADDLRHGGAEAAIPAQAD